MSAKNVSGYDVSGRRGVRLAVDPGAVRVGLAISDPDGILASPLQTLKRDARLGTDLDQVAAIVLERDVVEVIVGRPTGLSGKPGAAAEVADRYAAELATRLAPVPVVRQDERLSTVTATRQLRESGLRGREQRSVIDQAAAVVILQTWLERSVGPGA